MKTVSKKFTILVYGVLFENIEKSKNELKSTDLFDFVENELSNCIYDIKNCLRNVSELEISNYFAKNIAYRIADKNELAENNFVIEVKENKIVLSFCSCGYILKEKRYIEFYDK